MLERRKNCSAKRKKSQAKHDYARYLLTLGKVANEEARSFESQNL